jgi:hypothetical protein
MLDPSILESLGELPTDEFSAIIGTKNLDSMFHMVLP